MLYNIMLGDDAMKSENKISDNIELIKSQVDKVIKSKPIVIPAFEPPQSFTEACQYMASRGKSMGIDRNISLRDFAETLIRMSYMILDNYGIVVKQNEILLNYYKCGMYNKEKLPVQIQWLIFFISYVIHIISEKSNHIGKMAILSPPVKHSKIKATWNELVYHIAIEQVTYPHMPKIGDYFDLVLDNEG